MNFSLVVNLYKHSTYYAIRYSCKKCMIRMPFRIDPHCTVIVHNYFLIMSTIVLIASADLPREKIIILKIYKN